MIKNNKQTNFLNVRGFKYEVLLDSLGNHPNTRLDKLRKEIKNQNLNEISLLCDKFSSDLKEFYFNRDPFVLNMILNYYVTNNLHMNQTDCVSFLKDELDYWQIDDCEFYSCCQVVYHDRMQNFVDLLEIKQWVFKTLDEKDNFGIHFFPNFR